MFLKKYIFTLLASRQTPKMEGHWWSAFHDCLFNIFAANLNIWRPTPPFATRGDASCCGDRNPRMKRRLTLFANWILRRIFGPKRDVNGEWRRLHNKELHNLHRSANMVRVSKRRKLRWAGHIARIEEGRSAFKISSGTPTRKRPLGRPRRIWEDNIRMEIELIRFRIGIIGEPLWMRHWIFWSHKPWS